MKSDVDVVVVGAGVSGIGAGYHLQDKCPDRSYVILEGRDDLGGTWDLFRYPGVRSDSDMHTLGYSFKPWTDPKSIADGSSILAYVRQTAAEYGIDNHIRYGHAVHKAEWSSERAQWTVHAAHDGEQVRITCNFLFMCAGYYSYRGGHEPVFAGSEDFEGQIIHPQKWPENLDYRNKKVVVIGSGATAVTLVPALANDATHVTMLQRSPTWMIAAPDVDKIANGLRRVLPDQIAYDLVRKRNIWRQDFVYQATRSKPEKVRKKLMDELGKHLDQPTIDAHFTPTYEPWDQRLCLVPNGDFFDSIKQHRASVVTDTIERFTANGIELTSGEHLDADIIVTATGLELVTLGDMDFLVDDEVVDFSQTWTYKGVAYSDVPNLVSVFGYVNASWTLRVDLNCEYVCRLLNHMTETNTDQCTPRLRPADEGMTARPWIDDFSAGYVQRMLPHLPKQGDREPWLNTQRYKADVKLLVETPLDDGVMTFTARVSAST